MLWFNKKSFLQKNDILSLYKTVRFFKQEFLLIDLIKDNLLNIEIETYSENLLKVKDEITYITDPDENIDFIKRRLVNRYKYNIKIIDFITDENNYIIDNNNEVMIEVLNYIIILLEYYTNTMNNKKVNTKLLHIYIINIVDVFKLIYKEYKM